MAEEAPPLPTDKSGNVYVRGPDGTLGTVAPDDLPGVQAAGGAVATARDMQQMQLDSVPTAVKALKVATGDLGFWASGGKFTPEGATLSRNIADGGTMGLSDLATKEAARAWGGDALANKVRDNINAFDAESPNAAKAGQFLGSTAANIAGGAIGNAGLAGLRTFGVGAAALANPGVAVGALGQATENALISATKGMLARGAMGRAGATALQFAGRQAVEMGLQGALQQTTDDLFQDHELSAQKILIAGGRDALIGGVTGGILGGVGSLAKSGLGALRSVRGAAATIAEQAEGAAGKALGSAEGAEARQLVTVGEDAINAASKARNAAAASSGAVEQIERGVGEAAGAGDKKAAAGWLDKLSSEQAVKALGGTRDTLRTTVKALGEDGTHELGQLLVKRGIVTAGDNAEGVLGRIVAHQDAVGDAIGKVVQEADSHVPFGDVVKRAASLRDELIAKGPQYVGAADAVEAAMEKVTRSLDAGGHIKPDGTVAVSELLKARRGLESIAYKAGKLGESDAKQAISTVARDLEDQIMNHLDAASPGMRKVYEPLKRDYQLLSHARRMAEVGTERLNGNQTFGLGEKIMGGAGAVAGALLGGGLGSLAGSAALGAASYLAKTRGNSVAAVMLSRMAEQNAALAAMHTFDDVTAKAASGLLNAAGKTSAADGILAKNAAKNVERGYAAVAAKKAASSGDSVISRARAAMDQVKSANDNAVMQTRIDQAVGDLRQTAPKLADAMANTMTRAASFLASKMPVETKPYTTLGAPDQKPTIDAVQAAKFLRYKEAVDNPQGCLDRFARGEVRREDCETLKAVAPLAFQQIQLRTQRKLDEARDAGKPIPYEQRLKLSIVLDIQGDASLAPGMIRVMQRNLTNPPDGGTNQPKPSAPRRPMTASIGTQLQGTDKLESS